METMKDTWARLKGVVSAGGLALSLVACGGVAPARLEPPARPEAPPELRLPAAPRGSIWADGYGPTLREASLDARRAVAEQISARLRSSLDAREQEHSKHGSQREVDARIRTETAFEHLELIQVIGDAHVQGGHVARAWVDRRRVVDALRADIAQARARLAEALPRIEAAAERRDSTVLLSAAQSPGLQLDGIDRMRRVVEHLGGQVDEAQVDADARRVEAQVASQRAAAHWVLEVHGDAPSGLREAVTAALSTRFAARGCDLRLVSPRDAAVGEGSPVTVYVRVELSTRDHAELGMMWRYLGLELQAIDAATGGTVLRFVALPELAKGGGRDWALADQALARSLDARLKDRAGPAFDAILCRR